METFCLLSLQNKQTTVTLQTTEGNKSFNIPASLDKSKQLAEEVLKILNGHDLVRDIFIAVDGKYIYSALIDCSNLSGKKQNQGLLYRLEEFIPIEAENLTADFIHHTNSTALGMAVETQPLKNIIDELENNCYQVHHICPSSLLGLWQLRNSFPEETFYCVVKNQQNMDVFKFQKKTPVIWLTSSSNEEYVSNSIKADILCGNYDPDKKTKLLLVANHNDKSKWEQLKGASFKVETASDSTIIEYIIKSCDQILKGGAFTWGNFRTDKLAVRNPWQPFKGMLKVSAVLLLLLVMISTGIFFNRGFEYKDQARINLQKQADEFQKLSPSRRVPTGILTALNSEYKKLSGLSGFDSSLPSIPNGLNTLNKIVSALPPAVRLRVTQMRITPSDIYIEGQTRNHSDAEVIAQSLRKIGFETDPPKTEHIRSGGVNYSIIALPANNTKK